MVCICNPEKYLTVDDLTVTRKDIKDAMRLSTKSEINHWQNKILSLVNQGILENEKEKLIRYMVGVTDGWIRP